MLAAACACAIGLSSAPLSAQFPYLVEDIAPTGGSQPQWPEPFDGKLFFWPNDPAAGVEPWISDGTAAGTVMLGDLNPGSSWSSTIEPSTASFNGWLYFSANDGVHGYELWRTDGTPGGTSLFFEFQPGASNSLPVVRVLNNRLLILASTSTLGREFWVSDGTVAGTQLLLDIGPGPATGVTSQGVVLGNQLLFSGNDGVSGREPWITDGTPANTLLLSDTRPGPSDGFTSLAATWSNLWLFAANDGSNGSELWVSDGSPAGTHLVLDIEPGSASSSPDTFRTAKLASGCVFLAATSAHGREPWISNGTAAGTFMLGDLDPSTSSTSSALIAPIDAAHAVIGSNSPSSGYEPWLTDGTQAGTQLVDMWPGAPSGSYSNQQFHGVGGRAFFPGQQSGTGVELATSDGTVAGTGLIKLLFPGTSSSFTIRLVEGDDFVFVMTDTQIGYSNGIAATTNLLPQDPALPPLTQLGLVTRAGNTLFLFATRADTGSELFAVRLDADGDGAIEYFDPLNVAIDCTCDAGLAPCGNDDASAGCANSTGLGARLDGAGSTFLSNDDLVLSVTQMPPLANGLVFLGVNATAPNTFFDGLRCIASPTSRYALKNAGAGGTFSYGPGLAAQSLALPASLQFIAGRTLRFQAWYRDGGGPCGSGSNFSNSASVTFTP